MGVRIYESDPSSDNTTLVSLEGSFGNPDEEANVDATGGDVKVATLYLATEQTTLSADIDDTQTTIPLAEARFVDASVPLIAIGNEVLGPITSGNGTTSVVAARGYGGTTPAAHSSGDRVMLAYNLINVEVLPDDNSGSDESSYLTFSINGSDYFASLPAPGTSLGLIAHDASLTFYRKLTVPADSANENKTDLIIVAEAELVPIA